MREDDSISRVWNDELTDKEVYHLGKIVAHWGAIEFEVFSQTLQSFEDSVDDHSQLPSAMNNLNFTAVLELWEERVVNKTLGERGKVLLKQLEKIKEAKEFRNSLVHSMLHWTPQDIGKIYAARVRKREFIKIEITGEELADFYLGLAEINFNIRAPGGLEDLAQSLMESGGSVSRKGLAMLSGHGISSDWLPLIPSDKTNEDK